jgi:hypothetical protein
MPVKRRIDKARLERITPEALGLFRQIVSLQCKCPPGEFTRACWNEPRCARCDERHRLDVQLFSLLRLKPWEVYAVQSPNSPCPYPDDSWGARHWTRDADAIERWCAFEAALAARASGLS